ncbi:Type 1 glutamine amidotransferase-like domain-containing protein [Paenibacillus sp. N1-5-1-14]|uniref:Type 1 glutamine amidotransferase-like domain-containing protein n=1 Tax=Paenibacillus radicibacter TaxID=2972488 RepID=UPI002158F17A|nr:Type 1 glutamine amidotransferase-like domain-containing protein [Paenibacillus radicibacter]MCR8644519.1 Type 1 glutamine amidotransferase-like domain-containing protein [Paenibacillus radicibacter]
MDKHLFFVGGGPNPYTPRLARKFAELVQAREGCVVILGVNSDWEIFMARYSEPLVENGIDELRIHLITLPTNEVDQVANLILQSAGVVIGGGDTNLYADYIVNTPIGNAIKQVYELGIPMSGFSAGALISPVTCVLSPKDNDKEEFQVREGLGLVDEVVIAVHFRQWEEENHLRQAVETCPNTVNYGIDENAGVYFLNGVLSMISDTEEDGVHTIVDGELKRINLA